MDPKREISVGNFGTCHCEGGDKIMTEAGKRGRRDTKGQYNEGGRAEGKEEGKWLNSYDLL